MNNCTNLKRRSQEKFLSLKIKELREDLCDKTFSLISLDKSDNLFAR